VSAALASAALPNKVAFGVRGLVNGLWLGVLNDRDLELLDETYYSRAAMYRGDEWNTQGLFGWERQLVDAHFKQQSRVAVLAAGGGREVLALRDLGYDAVGYEPHPELVSVACDLLARHGYPPSVEQVERDVVPAGMGVFDAIILGWGALSLVQGRSRRARLLAQLATHVAPGGPVLVSFFHRAADYRELKLTAMVANGIRSALRRERIDAGDTLSPNLVHVFTRDELAADAAGAGLTVAAFHVTGVAEVHVDNAAAVLVSV